MLFFVEIDQWFLGWKDSVNVHTYPKYLLNKSLSTTCVLCSRERRMTCICRWVHCAKQQWYGSLSQLFWSVHSCHMDILEIRQQSSEAIAMTCVFPNDPCIYLKLNRFYTYIVCTVNFKSIMVHIISKCGFFSCSGKWFVKQEI